jgi:hypothetical protein
MDPSSEALADARRLCLAIRQASRVANRVCGRSPFDVT